MLTVATPSTGWIVGYDDDGVLKQKDTFGVITEIGGGLTNTNDLQTVLSLGNDSGVNSIIMGTSTFIKSNNGGGKIELDNFGTNSVLITTDNSGFSESGLRLQNNYAALFSGGFDKALELKDSDNTAYLYNLNSGTVSLGVYNSISPTYDELDEIKISYNTSATASTGDNDKQAVLIGTRNSQISNGIVNTVVVGGQNITATQSDSTYVPNLFIQGGKSIKSTDSNIIFTLNDNGKTLLDRNGGSYDKSWIQFSEDSNYREFIDLGVNTDLGYGSQSGIILRATAGPTYGWVTYSVVSIDKSNIVLESNDLDNTGNQIKITLSSENNQLNITGSTFSFRGLEYSNDYSASYSVRSLVDKQYVDTQVSSVSSPDIFTVLSTGNDTNNQNIIMGTGTTIKSGNPVSGGQINLDFGLNDVVLISTDNGVLSSAYVELSGNDIEISSSQFYLEANNGQLEIGNNEGLKYTTQQTSFQNRSLVDKEYVDLGTASIWNNLATAAYSPTSSQANYFPFYTSSRNLSVTSSVYSSVSKTKGTINGTFSTGTLPKNIFYDSNSKKMIVVNESSNNVTIINSLTKAVVGTVSVGTQPHGIAFNQNTNDVFISNKGSNNISKFNLSTLVISATISVGTFPEGIQYLDNNLYVANRVSNNISIVDTTTNLISATISTSTPKEFTYDSKNNKLWFIGVGPDYVGVIDPNTNTVINSVQVGSNPFNLEYDSNNDRIWVSNNGSFNISIIDTSTNLISATVSLGVGPSIIKNNPVNNYMYVSDYSGGQFFEIDINSLTVTNTVSAGGFSGGLSYNDYTGELYYSRTNLNQVLAYQTVNLNGGLVGISKTMVSSELDVDGTITTTGFRLPNGAVKDYVLTSDGSGRASWQPKILEIIGGSGLTGSGTSGTVSLSVDFSTVASVSFVNTGTASIWSAISSFSSGLTPSNGLSEVTTGYIGIGGTLSQNVNIDGQTLYSFDLDNLNTFDVTTKGASINSDNSASVTVGTVTDYSEIDMNSGSGYLKNVVGGSTYSQVVSYFNGVNFETYDGSLSNIIRMVFTPETVNDNSTDNFMIIEDNQNSKGLVYFDDYTAKYSTFSLVHKGYVDSVAGSMGATNGIYEVSPGIVGLGGTLSQTTTIDLSNYNFTINTSNSEISLNRISTSYPGTTNTFKLENKYAIVESDSALYRASLEIENSDDGNLSIQLESTLGTYSNWLRVMDDYLASKIESTDGSGSYSSVWLWNSPQSLTSGDITTNNHLVIIDQIGNKGLVYDEDYSSNFSNNSLVTKSWVETNTTSKYSITRGFTASTTETITHNLGTDEVIVQAYDSTGVQVIPGTVQIINTNNVDITFSSTLSNIKIVVIG